MSTLGDIFDALTEALLGNDSTPERAAAEDEAAQVALAGTLKNVTGATKDQVAEVERRIATLPEVLRA